MTPLTPDADPRLRSGPTGAVLVLVATADQAEREALADALPNYRRILVASAHEGELFLATGGVAVVIAAVELQDMAGLEWLGQLRRRKQTAMRLFAPQQSTEDLAIAAVNLAGVFRYVRKPTQGERLDQAVAEAIEVAGHRSGPACMREAVAKTIKAHSQCRGSLEGCLIQEQQDRVPHSDSFLRRLSSQMGWIGIGILGMSVFLLSGLLMGIGVFAIIYVVKSSLGIDLVPDWHLRDWLGQ
jgi:DNA-binding NarL/FixJ family response regulator